MGEHGGGPDVAANEPGEGLAIGVVTGPHGVRGGLRVKLYDPSSPAVAAETPVTLHGPDGVARILRVWRWSPVPGSAMARVFLDQLQTREQAEAVRGHELWIPRASRPELDSDEFYLADVIGCRVEQSTAEGRKHDLGVVVGFTSNGAQDLLEVVWDPEGEQLQWLVPVVPEIIRAVGEGRIEVDLPQGMGPREQQGKS